MSKLENHWFPHDINASSDTKIQKLEYKLGLTGYAIFFKLVEVLMQNNGAIDNDLDMLAFQLKCTNTELIRAVLNDFDLFVVDDSVITSNRVLYQLNKITEKSEKARESANKRWESN